MSIQAIMNSNALKLIDLDSLDNDKRQTALRMINESLIAIDSMNSIQLNNFKKSVVNYLLRTWGEHCQTDFAREKCLECRKCRECLESRICLESLNFFALVRTLACASTHSTHTRPRTHSHTLAQPKSLPTENRFLFYLNCRPVEWVVFSGSSAGYWCVFSKLFLHPTIGRVTNTILIINKVADFLISDSVFVFPLLIPILYHNITARQALNFFFFSSSSAEFLFLCSAPS